MDQKEKRCPGCGALGDSIELGICGNEKFLVGCPRFDALFVAKGLKKTIYLQQKESLRQFLARRRLAIA